MLCRDRASALPACCLQLDYAASIPSLGLRCQQQREQQLRGSPTGKYQVQGGARKTAVFTLGGLMLQVPLPVVDEEYVLLHPSRPSPFLDVSLPVLD